MLRSPRQDIALLSTAAAATGLATSRRHLRYGSMVDTLAPIAGQSQGQLSILNEICVNADGEEERRRPTWRHEVYPKTKSHSYLGTMWKWGFNSLSLCKLTNEDPGPWWNANSSTLVSTWSQIGDYANAGMWSGVWRYTYGTGQFNLRPFEARSQAWGRKGSKPGVVRVNYDETVTQKPQYFTFPHTKDHVTHKRIKNPPLPGFSDIDGLHGKRFLREVQYHLGNGLRYYLIDGVFGSFNETSTPYRIITDNASHAYFASIASIRKFNIVAQQEIMLTKRVQQSPLDEWGWRRPGVVVYHAPSYDFEAPRIVEEFGGPRPQDLSLKYPKAVLLEPYSIPMKGIIAAEPECQTLVKTIAFLCARWGFYADDKRLLTLEADSILSADGTKLTVVVSDGATNLDALKASKHLFGAHHHRLNGTLISRAWDHTTINLKQKGASEDDCDYVEQAAQVAQRPLTTYLDVPQSKSHRFHDRRHVSEFGFKYPHNYLGSAEARAAAGGHLFGSGAAAPTNRPRPNAFNLNAVHVVVLTNDAAASAAVTKSTPEAAAKVIVSNLEKNSWLYAEADKLAAELTTALTNVASVATLSSGQSSSVLDQLARTGSL